jgi:PIN domain nuclease of toxin-antitoxin system
MNHLLDTHTVLWCAANSTRLSETARKTVLDPDGHCFVSIVSAWEVAVKSSIGKLRLAGGVAEFHRIVDENGFVILPIKRKYLEIVETLPFHHRDPFDRMLVAAAMSEGMRLVTADMNMRLYAVDCVW